MEQKCFKAKLNRALKCSKRNLTQVDWHETRASSNIERIHFQNTHECFAKLIDEFSLRIRILWKWAFRSIFMSLALLYCLKFYIILVIKTRDFNSAIFSLKVSEDVLNTSRMQGSIGRLELGDSTACQAMSLDTSLSPPRSITK